jgi:hypothetical protein
MAQAQAPILSPWLIKELPAYAELLPSIATICGFLSGQKNYDLVGYFNADIDFLPGFARSLRHVAAMSREVLHCWHRFDVDDAKPLGAYLHGLDVFISSPGFLGTPKLHSLFLIGKPGWDYHLPLRCPAGKVQIHESLDLIHHTHPSGFAGDWSGAMIVVAAIHLGMPPPLCILQIPRTPLVGSALGLLARACLWLVIVPPLGRRGWHFPRRPYRTISVAKT